VFVVPADGSAAARDPRARRGARGSYGGYLMSWLIGHPDRFAAACSERTCITLESEEWRSGSAGYFRYGFGVMHLARPEVYRQMSPMSHVRGIDTPPLILHSEDDLRCHVEQADQLYGALRMLGMPGAGRPSPGTTPPGRG
jgi:dipeptidyl aminopeptidase/acylaminoacyl peptidase